MATLRLCSIPNCGKPARRRGLCSAHHSRFLRHGDPLGGGRSHVYGFIKCSVDSCEKRSSCQGMCGAHYQRWLRHGDATGGGTKWGAPIEWLRRHTDYNKDECLTWPFAREQNGYAAIRYRSKNERAHRLMCILVHGDPPSPKHEAAHSCGNGHLGCVAPSHLRWDTRSGNFADKLIHGTHNRGDRCPVAKLRETEVRVIRELLKTERPSVIAARFGVAPATIYSIGRRKSWAWMA
jgi:hypothetical protein